MEKKPNQPETKVCAICRRVIPVGSTKSDICNYCEFQRNMDHNIQVMHKVAEKYK